MTLNVKIFHNSPGYPVRALVSARDSTGRKVAQAAINDREHGLFCVHAGQYLVVTEEGHQDFDLVPIARRAYEAFCDHTPGQQHKLWLDLPDPDRQAWVAVARAFS